MNPNFDQATSCDEVAALDASAMGLQFAALSVNESKNLTEPAKAAILRELRTMHERVGRFAQLAKDADTLGRKMAESGVANG